MSSNELVKAMVERVSDAAWLSEQLGYGVRVESLRIKPGTSITAGVRDEFGGHGWVRLLWPGGEAKARKHLRKARDLGRDVRERILDGGFLLQHGTVLSDPKLMQLLHARTNTDSFADVRQQDAAILRYNPERRLVLANADATRVHRITAQRNPVSPALYRALSAHVALPALYVDDATSPHHSSFAFVGDGDLLDGDLGVVRAEECARKAGELFAQLHTSTRAIDADLFADLRGKVTDPCAQATAHLELFDIMDPAVADRLRTVLAALESQSRAFGSTQQPVLCHGDASPDQVLFATDGRMWLTDLDRVQLAPAALDLGSYLAVASDPEGEAFLEGYEQASNEPVGRERTGEHRHAPAIRLATAFSHVARLAEPLRSADPDWRERTHNTLTTIEQLLATSTRITTQEATS